MDINEAKLKIKSVLTESRYEHSLRVCDVAIKIGEQFSLPQKDIELAAIFHDYAKCFKPEILKAYILKYKLPQSLLDYHHELWHGPVASIIIAEKFNIHNPQIQSAIYYHTTGRANMSALDYVIYVADYIEPKRNFPTVEMVREIASHDVVLAFHVAIKNSIKYLMEKDQVIHPDSFSAYNHSIKLSKER